ncbi:inhibitor of growth protein 4-like [Paramacrobiotus metropolitanus]|uniref:inhibitor of growth protein 4-like n=1 Tax=Paramacrobiotus metropolitanus TaxID=2943436 RepID=UPI0024463C6E|nr:inhibitor of growth protein 4-like [Paramacrobiotus metropolitanus]
MSSRYDRRKQRSPSSERITRESDKRKKNVSSPARDKVGSRIYEIGDPTPSTSRDAIPSTSGSYGSSSRSRTSGGATTPKQDSAHQMVKNEATGQPRNRLTRQIFEQIPFLESDPLKALEMLKKMVQESGLETLYANVNENTSRARDFSDRIAELKRNVDSILKFMMSGKASEQEKLEKYREMKTIWAKIHGLNEAKVKLTQNAYDMVDRVIRRLDKELEAIVSEIGSGKSSSAEKNQRDKGALDEGPGRARVRGADPFDMPVDPNEPTYCECKQISFGEMIACDNQSCPIEWFHFACVGLTSKPKGKWFCKRCVASGQNKVGKKKKSRLGIIEKYASASDKSEVEHILTASDSD